jgi:hypothetical protein
MRCIWLLLPSDLNLLSLTVIFDGDHHDYSYSIQKAEMLDENLLGEATGGECTSFNSAKRSSIPAVTSTWSYYSVGEHCFGTLMLRCLFGCFPLNLKLTVLFFKSLHLDEGVGMDLILPMFFDKYHDQFE